MCALTNHVAATTADAADEQLHELYRALTWQLVGIGRLDLALLAARCRCRFAPSNEAAGELMEVAIARGKDAQVVAVDTILCKGLHQGELAAEDGDADVPDAGDHPMDEGGNDPEESQGGSHEVAAAGDAILDEDCSLDTRALVASAGECDDTAASDQRSIKRRKVNPLVPRPSTVPVLGSGTAAAGAAGAGGSNVAAGGSEVASAGIIDGDNKIAVAGVIKELMKKHKDLTYMSAKQLARNALNAQKRPAVVPPAARVDHGLPRDLERMYAYRMAFEVYGDSDSEFDDDDDDGYYDEYTDEYTKRRLRYSARHLLRPCLGSLCVQPCTVTSHVIP